MSTENTQFFIAGDILLDIFDANYQPQGLIGPMNGEAVGIQPQSDRIDQTSKMRAGYGQVRNSVVVPKPAQLKLVLRDAPTDVLAMALGGEVAPLSTGAQTVANEAVTARLGKWVDLQWSNLNAGSVVVTDTTGATTYAEGVDYEINYRLGLIRALAGGAIADGAALLVDYTTAALSGERISALTRSQFKCRIIVDGVNMAQNNRRVRGEIFRAALAPEGELDLLSNSHINAAFAGVMETPVGQTAPFVLDYL